MALGLNAALLQLATTAELALPAARPLLSGLHTERLRRTCPALQMIGLAESLKDCAAEFEAFLRR